MYWILAVGLTVAVWALVFWPLWAEYRRGVSPRPLSPAHHTASEVPPPPTQMTDLFHDADEAAKVFRSLVGRNGANGHGRAHPDDQD